jgi:hypothetical protein
VVTLTVGRAAADTWVGDRWDGTIWNNRLEPSFQIKWAEVNGRGEGWYIDLDEAASIGRIQMERYRASHTACRKRWTALSNRRPCAGSGNSRR